MRPLRSASRDWLPLLPGVLLFTSCVGAPPAVGPLPSTDRAYTIYHEATDRFLDLEGLAVAAEGADVLFFGEFHDDAVAHQAQRDLLERLTEGDREVVLGLEMFERDVQPVLDQYRSGRITEAEMLERARPWPNYESDYRPLVEAARGEGWEVIATNLPQELATAIARRGLEALTDLPGETRSNAAEEFQCPQDAYWDRFVEAMGGSDGGGAHAGTSTDPMLRRMFEAQCARDETMAEAIARVSGDGRLLLHVNGAFHTNHRLGIVPRLLRRDPDARVLVLAAVQVDDVLDPDPSEFAGQADYLIFTPTP